MRSLDETPGPTAGLDLQPHGSALPRATCLTLLRRRSLGRLASSDRTTFAVTTVAYVIDGDDVIFRTSALTSPGEGEVVILQVETVDATGHPWIVLVVGTCSVVTDEAERFRLSLRGLSSQAPSRRDAIVRLRPGTMAARSYSPPADG